MGRAPLELVLTTAELKRRGGRAPEYQAESRALASLLDTEQFLIEPFG